MESFLGALALLAVAYAIYSVLELAKRVKTLESKKPTSIPTARELVVAIYRDV